MFNNAKDFIQAMLDGRKFETDDSAYYFSGDTFHQESKVPWLISGTIRFDEYSIVREVVEPEWYKNIKGDGVFCWNDAIQSIVWIKADAKVDKYGFISVSEYYWQKLDHLTPLTDEELESFKQGNIKVK